MVDARAGPGHNTKKMMVSVVLKPAAKKRILEDEDAQDHKILKKKKVASRKTVPIEKFEKIRSKRKDKSGVRRRIVEETRQITAAMSGFIDLGYWRRYVSNIANYYD